MADSSNPFEAELARRAAAATPATPDDPFTAELQRRQAPPSSTMNADQLSAALGHEVALPTHTQAALDAAAPPTDPTPEWGLMPGTGDALKNIRLAAKTLWTADPHKLEPILKSELPDATFATDKSGNVKMGYQGHEYWLNKPGLSEQDILPWAMSIAMYSGIGKLGSILGKLGGMLPGGVGRGITAAMDATGFGAKAAGEAAKGAATGLGMTVGAQRSGVPETAMDYALEAGAGAAGGVFGQLMSTGLGRALASRRIGILDPTTGAPTRTALAAFKQAGIDPGTLSRDTLDSINMQLRGRAVDPRTVAATARAATAERYGFPVTAGQATGDLTQIQNEELMRQGGRGAAAQRTMGAVAKAQEDAVPQVAENMAGRVAPRAVLTPTETGAGDVVGDEIRNAAARAHQGVDAAYDATRALMKNQPVTFAPGVGASLPGMAQKSLSGFMISPKLAPATDAILGKFDDLAQRGDAITLEEAETIRKEIGSAIRSAATPEDKAAAVRLRNTYDTWLDQTAGSSGNIGDPAVLQSLKDARAARRAYGQAFEQRDPKDKVGALIESVVNGSVQPQALVDRMMGGQRGFDVGAAEIGKRLQSVLGADSPGWQTIQRSAIMRILLGNADQQAKGLPEFKTMLDRVNAALAGRGQASVSAVLGAKGVDELQGVRDALSILATPVNAMNRSRSGYVPMRDNAFRRLGPYIGGLLGGAAGGFAGGKVLGLAGFGGGVPAGTAIGTLTGKGAQDFLDAIAAVRAARGYRAPLRATTVQVGPVSVSPPIAPAGAATAMGFVPQSR